MAPSRLVPPPPRRGWGEPCGQATGTARTAEGGMDKVSFGLTLLVVGMGGTLAALALLAALMNLLKKLFPVKDEGA